MLTTKMKWMAAAVTALALTGYGGYAAVNAASITADEAKNIAFTHAAVNAADAHMIKVKQDYEHGVKVYDVEFLVGNKEYDYEISQDSGEILKFDYDVEHYTRSNAVSQQSLLSVDEASRIALSKVPGATEQNLRIRSDYDHGRPTYEGKIYYNMMEYEFEINALTGEIIEWSFEKMK